ncbi:hypothetical protein WIW49_14015 [Xanthomonas euroxanthea]
MKNAISRTPLPRTTLNEAAPCRPDVGKRIARGGIARCHRSAAGTWNPRCGSRCDRGGASGAPCVSLAADHTSISIPTTYLEKLAEQAQGDMPAGNERARFGAWQQGRSARWLLDLPGTVTDARGCESSPIQHAHRASQSLVGGLLESGIAAVWVHDQPGFVSRLRVRDYNRGCGRGPIGSSSYRVANGPAVILLITCTH